MAPTKENTGRPEDFLGTNFGQSNTRVFLFHMMMWLESGPRVGKESYFMTPKVAINIDCMSEPSSIEKSGGRHKIQAGGAQFQCDPA